MCAQRNKDNLKLLKIKPEQKPISNIHIVKKVWQSLFLHLTVNFYCLINSDVGARGLVIDNYNLCNYVAWENDLMILCLNLLICKILIQIHIFKYQIKYLKFLANWTCGKF